MADGISMGARREVVAAVTERYALAGRREKGRILDELTAVTGWHRKHAVRALSASQSLHSEKAAASGDRPAGDIASTAIAPSSKRQRKYNAIHDALIALWEALDRICGQRLKVMIASLLPALERHGRLTLSDAHRALIKSVSAATIDRILVDVRVAAAGGRRRRVGFYSAIRREAPIRTFNDWHDPQPGFCEIDMVAHGGTSVAGSFIQTLTMTDIATGWTECLPTATAEARRAIALAPDYPVAHATLGVALALTYRDVGGADEAATVREALDHAQKALAMAPSDGQVLALVSVALHSIGRFADAQRCAEAAVRANPNNASAYNYLAVTLVHFSRFDEAFAAFDEALRLAPRGSLQFSMLAERAAASYAAGKRDEALVTSHEALRLNSQHMQCLQNLASLWMEMGRPAEAQDAIRRLRVMLPERSLGWHLLRIRRCFYPPHLHDAWCAHFTSAWNATPEQVS